MTKRLFTTSFALESNFYDANPKNQARTIDEIERFLIKQANRSYTIKTSIPAIHGCTFVHESVTKRHDSTLSRHCVILDFDVNPDIDFIRKQLKDYTYFAWTTFSHTEIKPRYRIWIPFSKKVKNIHVWKKEVVPTLQHFFKTIGFKGDNVVDQSCYTYSQLAALPCINELTGVMPVLHFNTGKESKLLDISKLEQKVIQCIKTDDNIPYAINQCNISTLNLLIDCLKTKPELQAIPYCSNAHLNRMLICVALQSIGATEHDFVQLDSYLRKPDTNSHSHKVWTNALKWKGARHCGILLRYLNKTEREMCGILPHIKQEQIDTNKIILEDGEYLTKNHIGDSGLVLLKAATGTGKNYLNSIHTNVVGDGRLVITSLNSIVNQNTLDPEKRNIFPYDSALSNAKNEKSIQSFFDKTGLTPEETVLTIDECHNFLIAGYRTPALAAVIAFIEKHNFKQVIFQSGTISKHSFDGFINFDTFIEVEKRNPMKLNYIAMPIHKQLKETVVGLTQMLNKMDLKGIVYYNNKEKNTAYSSFFNDKEIKNLIVDSDRTKQLTLNKELEDFVNNANFEMGDTMLIIGTACICEGVNITDKLPKTFVICIGNEHPESIRQLPARFRNVDEVDVYHIFFPRNDTITEEEFIFRQSKNMKLIYDHIDIVRKSTSQYGKSQADMKNILESGKVHKSLIADFKIEMFTGHEIDQNSYMLASMMAARGEDLKEMFYTCPEYKHKKLLELGFDIKEEFYLDDLLSPVDKQELKDTFDNIHKINKEKKIEIVNELKSIVDEFENTPEYDAVANKITIQKENNLNSIFNIYRTQTKPILEGYRTFLEVCKIYKIKKEIVLEFTELFKTKKPKDIINLLEAKQCKLHISNYLKNKQLQDSYTIEDANKLISEIFEFYMRKVNKDLGFDLEECFKYVLYHMTEFSGLSKNFTFKDNNVSCNSERPSTILKKWFDLESVQKRHLGNLTREINLKSIL